MPRFVGWVGGFFAVLVLGACSGGGASVTEIRMLDNSFSPQVVEVGVGETVRFVNDGNVPHDAHDVGGSWNTELLDAGSSQEVAFNAEGTYQMFCSLHSTKGDSGEYQGMVGTVVVGDGDAGTREAGPPTERDDQVRGDARIVPDDYPTIQSAVDAAVPGDLVLIQPGTYKESVSVTTPQLVIRGADRNRVILDGEYTRENAFVVVADGVAIENMTAIGYTVNDFFWNGVTGYRGSYLTAIDGWVYGIYAFDSVDGLFEHSYASGSWDAGFYIGQCDPCNAMITDSLAEFNGLGYSGTNSSGPIYIVNSEWRHNVAGIVPNTLDSELLPPVRNVTVAGNYIHDNGEVGRAPSRVAEWSGFGNGVVLAGARDSVVHNNLLVNNATSGVQVVSMLDKNLWPSGGNVVRDNVIRGSGRADLALGGPIEQGTCFADNDAATTLPYALEFFHSCDGVNLPLFWGMATSSDPLGRIAQAKRGQNPQLGHGDAPMPALDFPQLPGGADAPVVPAVDVFAGLDTTSFATPELPAGVEIDDRRPVVLGVAVDGGFWPVWMGAVLWWIPLLAYLAGGAWALINLWRSERGLVARIVWTLVIVLIPVIGVLAYALFGNKATGLGRRLGVALGGLGVWLGIVVVSLLVGGIV